MKLERLPYEPGAVLDFYVEGLEALGAVCERTWHDRLGVLAEGRAASLWNSDGAPHETELHFVPPDASVARDAAHDVFPGSPITFRLAEALAPAPLTLERVVLAPGAGHRPPETAVAEKLWRAQFPGTHRWHSPKPFAPDWHFSLLALARCEIQAIDQHWSLHRLAISVCDGDLDENLAEALTFAEVQPHPSNSMVWPVSDPVAWRQMLERALVRGLAADLAPIRARQQNSLRRELDRVDAYFANYARELGERSRRGTGDSRKVKTADRLAAAHAEHARRREDQVARHEIRIHPHFDSLLLIAEPAWRAELLVEKGRNSESHTATYLPRLRAWKPSATSPAP